MENVDWLGKGIRNACSYRFDRRLVKQTIASWAWFFHNGAGPVKVDENT
jgi:hypothetical protein